MASDDDGAMASDGVFDIDIAGDMAGADAGDIAPVLSHATRPVAASPNAQGDGNKFTVGHDYLLIVCGSRRDLAVIKEFGVLEYLDWSNPKRWLAPNIPTRTLKGLYSWFLLF